MPRTRIKICCIADRAEAALAIAAGADALGLVSAMPSGPGVIPDGVAAAVAASVPLSVASILLTSETTAPAIARQHQAIRPSALQFVDHVRAGDHRRLDVALPGVRRLQVIHVTGPEAVDQALAAAGTAHALLLDSGDPSASVKVLGGTGRVHDWDVSAEIVRQSPVPVFLAGGLSAANVAEAIRAVRPFGVDVCSGVRTGGRLDAGRLGAFTEAVRRADAD
ncbi:MAG: phosphoribosylanthranilate isomerase [Bacteroidota bacterium]